MSAWRVEQPRVRVKWGQAREGPEVQMPAELATLPLTVSRSARPALALLESVQAPLLTQKRSPAEHA
jgi:hypothetical protein